MKVDNDASLINLFFFAVGVAFLLVEGATYIVGCLDEHQERKRLKRLKEMRDEAYAKAIGEVKAYIEGKK